MRMGRLYGLSGIAGERRNQAEQPGEQPAALAHLRQLHGLLSLQPDARLTQLLVDRNDAVGVEHTRLRRVVAVGERLAAGADQLGEDDRLADRVALDAVARA